MARKRKSKQQITAEPNKHNPRPIDEKDQHILKLIVEKPGITNIEISEALDMDRTIVGTRINRPEFQDELDRWLKPSYSPVKSFKNKAWKKAFELLNAKRAVKVGEKTISVPDNFVQAEMVKLGLKDEVAELIKIQGDENKPLKVGEADDSKLIGVISRVRAEIAALRAMHGRTRKPGKGKNQPA